MRLVRDQREAPRRARAAARRAPCAPSPIASATTTAASPVLARKRCFDPVDLGSREELRDRRAQPRPPATNAHTRPLAPYCLANSVSASSSERGSSRAPALSPPRRSTPPARAGRREHLELGRARPRSRGRAARARSGGRGGRSRSGPSPRRSVIRGHGGGGDFEARRARRPRPRPPPSSRARRPRRRTPSRCRAG